jgi:hypothetical protein
MIYTGFCGPIKRITSEGKRYMLTVIDDYIGYTEIYLMAHKSGAGKHIKNCIEMIEKEFGKAPTTLKSDRENEYVNNELMNLYLKKWDIASEFAIPYSLQQNGKAERWKY